jgi:hypothetical protein
MKNTTQSTAWAREDFAQTANAIKTRMLEKMGEFHPNDKTQLTAIRVGKVYLKVQSENLKKWADTFGAMKLRTSRAGTPKQEKRVYPKFIPGVTSTLDYVRDYEHANGMRGLSSVYNMNELNANPCTLYTDSSGQPSIDFEVIEESIDAHENAAQPSAITVDMRIAGALANGGHVVGDSLRTSNGLHLRTLTADELASIPAEKITPLAEHKERVRNYIAAHSMPVIVATVAIAEAHASSAEAVAFDAVETEHDAELVTCKAMASEAEAGSTAPIFASVHAIGSRVAFEPIRIAHISATKDGLVQHAQSKAGTWRAALFNDQAGKPCTAFFSIDGTVKYSSHETPWDRMRALQAMARTSDGDSERKAMEAIKTASDASRETMRENTPKNYDFLTRSDNAHYQGGVFAAKNIRAILKRDFPCVKFSVRSSYTSCNVNWTDGPTDDQVNDSIGHFKTGRFDSMADYSYFDESEFNKIYGGVQYLFTNRKVSEDIIKPLIFLMYGPYGPTFEDWKSGKPWSQMAHDTHGPNAYDGDEWAWLSLVRRKANETQGI